MGFFKDLKQLQDTARDLTPASDGEKAQYLMATGQAGSATITAIRQTGTTVNDNPECDLDLQVTVNGSAPYPVTHRQVIAQVALASFQPGATVSVRVDPDDAQSLIVA